MARKLQPEEAEVFTGAVTGLVPTDPDAFLKSLVDKQDEPFELTFVPALWIKGTPPESMGS